MADLPSDGYIPNAARTEGEMKTALEALRDVLAQMLGGGLGAEALTISGGVITPTRGRITVDTEASASIDDLDTIQTTNLPDGSLLMISTTSDGRDIVMKHGTGNLILRDDNDRLLTETGDIMFLRRSGSSWEEIYTFYHTTASQGANLGLGTAAYFDAGSGNNLDADKLDGNHASAFLGVSAQAADSDKLDGVQGASYARLDLSSVQAFLGNVRGTLKVIAYDPSMSTPQFELCDDDAGSPLRRGLLFFDGTNVILRLYQSNGTTIAGSLKITDTTIEWSPDAESTWYEIWHEENDSSLPVKAANVIAGTPSTNYVSATIPASTVLNVTLNRFSFFPSLEHWGGNPIMRPYRVNPPGSDPTNPKFSIFNDYAGTVDIYLSWEYLS